jgi:hypothetical protein
MIYKRQLTSHIDKPDLIDIRKRLAVESFLPVVLAGLNHTNFAFVIGIECVGSGAMRGFFHIPFKCAVVYHLCGVLKKVFLFLSSL